MQANPTTETQPTTQTQAPAEPEVTYPNDTPAMTEFRTKILNKPVCVTLADQRKVLGKISCIDQQKNLVMIDAIEEIPEQYVAPINEKLPVISRSIMKIKNYITLPEDVASNEEKVKELEEEFFKNKFYLGQAIIPGHCISKLEIQKKEKKQQFLASHMEICNNDEMITVKMDPAETHFFQICPNIEKEIVEEYYQAILLERKAVYNRSIECLENLYQKVSKLEFISSKVLVEIAKQKLLLANYKEAQQILDQIPIPRNTGECTYLSQYIEGEVELTKGIISLEQKFFSEAFKQVQRALEIFKENESLQSINISKCYRRIGELCIEQKEYQKGSEYFERGLDLINKNFKDADDHLEKAKILYQMSVTSVALQKHKEAIETLEECKKILSKNYSSNHPEIAKVAYEFGFVYTKLNYFNEAELNFKNALNMFIECFGENHPFIARTYLEIGRLYADQEKLEEAAKCFDKALEIAKKFYNEECPALGSFYIKLGYFYLDQERYEDALEVFSRVLKIYKESYGEDHTFTAVAYHTIGTVYKDMGRYKESLENYEQDLKISKKYYGELHPEVSTTYYWIAMLLWLNGRGSEALESMQKCFDIDVNYHGQDSLQVASNYHEMARILIDSGNQDKALEYFKKSNQIERQYYGEIHPRVGRGYFLTGLEMRDHELYEGALKNLQKALEIDKQCFGEEHPRIARINQAIGNTYNNQGSYDAALKSYDVALKLNKKLFGDKSLEVQELYRNIANVYYNQDQYTQAVDVYLEALDIVIKTKGPNHVLVGTLLTDIGNCMAYLEGKESETMQHLHDGMKILLKHPMKDKMIFLDNFYSRGHVLKNLKDYKGSLMALRRALTICKHYEKSKVKNFSSRIARIEKKALKIQSSSPFDDIWK